MTFVSYAQNFEDVLLFRALRHVAAGFYIDAGAAHPDTDSVTRAFYDRGWHGINIEPADASIERLRAARPLDVNVHAALGVRPGRRAFFEVEGTGLSTLDADLLPQYGAAGFDVRRTEVAIETLADICRRHAPSDIHFLKIDVEGSEHDVLAGADFAAYRPWIVLIEATAPMSETQNHAAWEGILLAASYRFVWFDGLNRFYVADEHAAELARHFEAPPNVFDDFLRAADTEWARRIHQAEARLGDALSRLTGAEALAAGAEARAAAAEHRARAAIERAETANLRLARQTTESAVLRVRAEASTRESEWLRGVLDGAETRAHDATQRLQRAEHDAERASAWLAAMRASSSWRLTHPLRQATSLVARARGIRPEDPPNLAQPAADPSPGIAPARPVPPPAPLRTVHQFHSGSAINDAITNAMLLTRRILRDLGYVSDIFVEHRDPLLHDGLLLFDELPRHASYVLIVRHSMGHDMMSRLVELPAPKILLYHNITPPELLSDDPRAQHYARIGREQLAALRPCVWAALADSEYNAIELRAAGFDAVQACPLLFDIDALLARAQRRAKPDHDEPFTILFVGRIVESKGQAELIAAFARFSVDYAAPARLVLIGRDGGPGDPYVQDLRATIREQRLEQSVVFAGLVSNEELHEWYAQADLYVSLSHHEGFGVPLIEAMVHGVPVLAWPSGAVPYTLGDAAELVQDRAPSAVAVQILALGRDPARRAAIVARQTQSLDRFSLRRQVPWLVRALVRAGAAPPSDPALRAALAAHMQFLIAGHINGTYSLAAINRTLALTLDAARPGSVRVLPVEGAPTTDLSNVPPSERARIATIAGRPPAATGPEIVISQHYPVYPPAIRGDLALALFFWEESVVPSATVEVLNSSFGGVLAPSSFVAKALIDSGVSIPVRTIGYAPALDRFRALRSECHDGAGPFTFLHVSSCFPRKGVDVLLAAYVQAFRRGDPVRLVIKGFPNPHNDVGEQIARHQAQDADTPAIEFINRDIGEAELLELYREADAVVLPARGEGFNLPAAEAMAAGRPVVVTGLGGHTDFCPPDAARLIEYSFAPSRSHVATQHSVWAEPDTRDLAEALRDAAANRRVVPEPALLLEGPAFAARLIETALDWLLAPPRRPLRLAWVSSWGVRCGIAEYSRALVDKLQHSDGIERISLLVDRRTPGADAEPGAPRVLPCWRVGDTASVALLAAAVSAEDPDAVVIQHQPALLPWGALAALVRDPALSQRVVTVTLHNTRHLSHIAVEERQDATDALSCVSRVLVHTVADLNLLKQWGLIANVTLFPHGAPQPGPQRAPTPLTREMSPLIGSYGFFLPEKGLARLIEAFSLLRKEWPGARLRLVNAEYAIPASAAEIASCRAAVDAAGLKASVEFITDFLPHERSLALLAECDVVVLPYEASQEASSAALRTALAAGAPVMVTPLPLFDEAGDSVLRLPGFDARTIAEQAGLLLGDVSRRREITEAAQAWLADHDWTGIARRLGGMLRGLHASRPPAGQVWNPVGTESCPVAPASCPVAPTSCPVAPAPCRD